MPSITKIKQDLAGARELVEKLEDQLEETLRVPEMDIEHCVETMENKWKMGSTTMCTYTLHTFPCSSSKRHSAMLPSDVKPNCPDCQCHPMLLEILRQLRDRHVPVTMAMWGSNSLAEYHCSQVSVFVSDTPPIDNQESHAESLSKLYQALPERLSKIARYEGRRLEILIFSSQQRCNDLYVSITAASEGYRANLVKNQALFWSDDNLTLASFPKSGRMLICTSDVIDAIDTLRDGLV